MKIGHLWKTYYAAVKLVTMLFGDTQLKFGLLNIVPTGRKRDI